MNDHRAQTLVHWVAEDFLPAGVRAGFTSRHGGLSTGHYRSLNVGFHVGDDPSAVRANRDILDKALGQQIIWMTQIHGDTIAHGCDAQQRNLGYRDVGEADAIIVEPGMTAAVMVADCVPLILISSDGTSGAVVHVGRAGLDRAIAPKVLETLGSSDVRAIVGPSICGQCYEVPADLAADIASRWPGTRAVTRTGTNGLDIANGLVEQLNDCGVTKILRSHTCTYESEEHYSHRRATHAGHQTGRFSGILQIDQRHTEGVSRFASFL